MQTSTTAARPVSFVIIVLAMAGLAVAIMQTVIVPIIPDLPMLLGVSADDASWLITATLLAGAVATPSLTRLADMYGKRRMMLISIGFMLVGSVLGALTTSFELAIVARVLQGFAVAVIPIGMSVMRDELPQERLGAAVALMSAMFGIGGAVGLPAAGFIYSNWGWHAIFWVSSVTSLLLLVGVVLVVKESPVRTGGTFDVLGAVILSGALLALLVAITKGGTWGWISQPILFLTTLSLVLFAVFIPWELRVGRPLVDLRTTIRRPVLLTNIASALISFAMYINMLTTTQVLQVPPGAGHGFGFGTTSAGFAMLPAALTSVLLAPVAAIFIRRFGARATLILGALILGFGYIGRVFFLGSAIQVIIGATVLSAGTAVALAAMPVLIMRSVPITETAAANGVNSLVRTIGTSASSAMVAAVLAASSMMVDGNEIPQRVGFDHVHVIAGVAGLVAAAIAWQIPGRVRGAITNTAGELRATGQSRAVVQKGVVRDPAGAVVAQAVVNVATVDGEVLDWSRTDAAGRFQVVVPEPGRFVVVTTAPGWKPTAQPVDCQQPGTSMDVRLRGRLTLDVTVSCDDQPVADAAVYASGRDGSPVHHGSTDVAGRVSWPLPQPGFYVITAIAGHGATAHAVDVLVARRSTEVGIDLSGG